jgi:hypothetical protein
MTARGLDVLSSTLDAMRSEDILAPIKAPC